MCRYNIQTNTEIKTFKTFTFLLDKQPFIHYTIIIERQQHTINNKGERQHEN